MLKEVLPCEMPQIRAFGVARHQVAHDLLGFGQLHAGIDKRRVAQQRVDMLRVDL